MVWVSLVRMAKKKQSCVKTAHMVFKRLKACGFKIDVLKERFNPTEHEKECFKIYYGKIYVL